jgi:peptidoglycan/LPS O-acetylase OafA/YrhL
VSSDGPGFLARFSRVTGSGAFIPEIDGLRFLAIALVVLFHLTVGLAIKAPATYTAPPGDLLALVASQGYHGVELFFVISGLILALPFAAHHLTGQRVVPLGQYFLRRVTRLEPPYMLCMVLAFLGLVLVKGRSASELLPHLGASLLYLHNLIYGAETPIDNVAWSLEIEIQFYLLVPVLAGVFAIQPRWLRRAVIALAAAASAVLAWWLIAPETRAWLSILRFLHFFLMGFLLADVLLVDWKGRPATSPAWDLATLLGWPLLLALWTLGRGTLGEALGFPAVAFLLAVAAFRGPWTNRVLTTPWLTTVGGMCYSIYLLHNPLLGAVLTVTSRLAPTGRWALDVLVQLALTLPAVLVPAGLYFVLVERPCMQRDWPRRLLAAARFSRASGR